ncbi:FecR family protein [Lacibacterium aquatile]|uniref:FecR family protein n=1 Tax=Lacibacterium aquatile TaxID=1168082 RepID=A0ABW5DSG4_9PROT
MRDISEPGTAAEWLVALLDAPDDSGLHARAVRWLETDPANLIAWEEIARTYELLGMTVPLHRDSWATAAANSKGPRPLPDIAHRSTLPTARHPGRRRLVIGWAAAIAACVTGLLVSGQVARWTADYTTGTGQTQAVTLADGSKIRLGPQSALSVTYSSGDRRVHLLSGEAFFDVTPDTTRPFRIETEAVETSVLGTSFEVRREDAATHVAVRSGTVSVRNGASTTVLQAGDWLHASWSGQQDQGKMPTTDIAAWQDGYLIAKDRPVRAVIEDLRPYFDGMLLLRGDKLAEQPLTGVYKLSDPFAALQAVAATQGAKITRITPWITVISEIEK